MNASRALVVLAVLSGCSQEPPSSFSDAGPERSTSVEGQFFPQHQQTPETGLPTGELHGRLEQVDGCLWLIADDGTRYLGLWPADFTSEAIEDAVTVHGRGFTATVGDRLLVSGGEYSESDIETVERLIGEAVPPDCLGSRYWLVGEFAG